MDNNTSVKELNTLLKGEYMAAESFDNYIENINEKETRKELQRMQQLHKQHTIELASRIQDLGGKPVHGVGATGKVAEVITKIKDKSKQTAQEYLEAAYHGEDQGIKMANEIVKGDLDNVSMSMVNRILNEDKTNLSALKSMKS